MNKKVSIYYFIFPIVFVFCLLFAAILNASMQGGEYFLESSVIDAGGGSYLSGGDYSSKGGIAQSFFPANTDISRGGKIVNRLGFYNPPHFTFQQKKPAHLIFPSGNMSLTIPPNAVDKNVYDIILNKSNTLFLTDPSKIAKANDKIIYNEGPWSKLLSNNLAEMVIFDEESYFTKPFAVPSILTMKYTDADNDGIVDNSDPPVKFETLRPRILDDSLEMWVRLSNSTIDPVSKTITVPLNAPGVIALIGFAQEEVKNTYVFPVPFRPYGPNAGSGPGQTGTESEGIIFAEIPQKGNIEIYSLDGVLVRKIKIPENLSKPIYHWDVRNDSGSRVASGVYIWRVVSGKDSKTGKLMIIW